MERSTDIEIKLRIGYALSDRLAPIACAIVKNITTSTKMIDDHPPSLRQCWTTARNNTARIAPERLLSVHTRT
jgi:hypothetical protein